jgi:thioredoxin-dependent peroxiredoxin
MVELRKRKAAAAPAPAPPAKKNSNPIKKIVDKAKDAVIDAPAKATNGTGKLAVGDTISLDGFGGEVETHTGEKTTLKRLLGDSKAGVVLFTYPKASTPGCEYDISFFAFLAAKGSYKVKSLLSASCSRRDHLAFFAALDRKYSF